MFGIVGVLVLLYWFIFISYRLHLILSNRRDFLNSSGLDSRVRVQNLYSYTTIRNRDICLIVLILLEMIVTAYSSFVLPRIPYYFEHTDADRKKPLDCIIPVIEYPYTHPLSVLLFTVLFVVILTQLMLISLLNLYLSGRYFGYSFPRKVIYKYIFFWGFQCILATICIIPKLQILFCPIVTLLIFLNWLNLFFSSRKVCRAIRSKMKEISLFEWNPGQYRHLAVTLKHYKIGNACLLIAFFFLVLALFCLTVSYFFNILASDCYLHEVYKINFSINSHEMVNKNIKFLLHGYCYNFVYDYLYALYRYITTYIKQGISDNVDTPSIL